MIEKNKKIIVIGGGILGLSIARKFMLKGYKNLTILEKNTSVAKHQSSRNSGVMHSGLYYDPNSLKSHLCRKGILLLKDYCNKNSIDWQECGKIVVASELNEIDRLEKLFSRGEANGLKGIKKMNSKEVNLIEPYVNSKAGIYVPEESIVNFIDVANKFKDEIISLGGLIKYSAKVKGINNLFDSYELFLDNGESINGDLIISATGLHSDKLAKLLDIDIANKQIIPFRGEYYMLKPPFEYLVKGLIYPVPNPSFPFLGVHFTKMINGSVEAGPNAILALAREGYNWQTINPEELYESISFIGLQRFIWKYPLTTAKELMRSISKTVFVKSLQRLIPDIKSNMLCPGIAGVRAQLMNTNGDLEQDFDIRIKGNIISVLNAPSPAATSSLSISNYVFNLLTK